MVAPRSLVASQLTAQILTAQPLVSHLNEVTGTLCYEFPYSVRRGTRRTLGALLAMHRGTGSSACHSTSPHLCLPNLPPHAAPRPQRLEMYVRNHLSAEQARHGDSVKNCLEGLTSGKYQAVLTDRSTLLWRAPHAAAAQKAAEHSPLPPVRPPCLSRTWRLPNHPIPAALDTRPWPCLFL